MFSPLGKILLALQIGKLLQLLILIQADRAFGLDMSKVIWYHLKYYATSYNNSTFYHKIVRLLSKVIIW